MGMQPIAGGRLVAVKVIHTSLTADRGSTVPDHPSRRDRTGRDGRDRAWRGYDGGAMAGEESGANPELSRNCDRGVLPRLGPRR
jgi:hypothetical protein